MRLLHNSGESGVISLNKIEDECPVLKTNFYGNGLLFFSDNIYDESKKNGTAKIAIDYSLSFDKNTAEKFRIWEGGGSLDKSLGDFEKLVRFIKDVDFNFDYSFCLIEDYVNLMQEHNDRPFNTIRALKRFDHLDYDKKLFDINNPRFSENRIDAGVRAMVTLDTFRSSPEIKEAQLRRLVVYIVLLKAVIIRQKKNVELKDQLYKLVRFCLTNLGKITKTELYVAWKLLKYGSEFEFFNPVSQISESSLRNIKGMSWDIFVFRYEETMTSSGNQGDFFVPFFASFDSKFMKFRQACPVRAVLIDEQTNIETIRFDELEFQTDLEDAIPDDAFSLFSSKLKLERMTTELTYEQLLEESKILEDELNSFL